MPLPVISHPARKLSSCPASDPQRLRITWPPSTAAINARRLKRTPKSCSNDTWGFHECHRSKAHKLYDTRLLSESSDRSVLPTEFGVGERCVCPDPGFLDAGLQCSVTRVVSKVADGRPVGVMRIRQKRVRARQTRPVGPKLRAVRLRLKPNAGPASPPVGLRDMRVTCDFYRVSHVTSREASRL